jgi:hypothetical protein
MCRESYAARIHARAGNSEMTALVTRYEHDGRRMRWEFAAASPT